MRQIWYFIVVGGFLAWVGSIFALIFNGMDKAGKFKVKQALFWLGCLIIGYALWIIGLIKAP